MAAALRLGNAGCVLPRDRAIVALFVRIRLRAIGLVMGFGAGVLISAVAFDLIEEAADMSSEHGAVLIGLFAGCATFFSGDWVIDRLGGGDRKAADGAQAGGSALGIVLGTEWERAARGGLERKAFPWGNELEPGATIE